MDNLELESHSSILGNIGLYSYGTACLAYIMLLVLALNTRRHPLGTAMLTASGLTAVWAGVVTVSTVLSHPLVLLMQLTEVLRNAAWIFFLLKLLQLQLMGTDHPLTTKYWKPLFGVGVGLLTCILLGTVPLTQALSLPSELPTTIVFCTWLALSILGLLLVEQFFRNSNAAELSITKHLCLGLGILFIYDFFMYAEALLFRQLDSSLWQARGIVTAMGAILIAITISRSDRTNIQENEQGLFLSRHVAFHALTLMGSGIYLITMALAAYFIRYLGGSWGGVLQIIFLCGAGLILVLLLFSGRIRASFRVWLSKNFFNYKYDYRIEWLQFTQTLASGDADIPDNITRAVANIAKSPAGLLWSRLENGRFIIAASWGMPRPSSTIELYSLPAWLEREGWIIDIKEWRSSSDFYHNLDLPKAVAEIPGGRLIIPLLFGEKLQGILLLQESELPLELNWEDRDLLKVAGRQAASHLAQYQADQALVESRQFEAFNRLSAYVIHDLKNILAQLSLMVANAQKHKHNPDFIDDMVETASNSVERMSKLMAQLRSGTEPAQQLECELVELLQRVVAKNRFREPAPSLIAKDGEIDLRCNPERLETVFGHLLQNAQEATSKQGQVTVRVSRGRHQAMIEVEDDGKGMDEQFIQQRLFKPFDSTKGLTGMGIGAFESLEYIRSLGGEINVTSAPGKGSLFKVTIPYTPAFQFS